MLGEVLLMYFRIQLLSGFVTLTLSYILVHLNLICLMEAALGLGMNPNWLADE